MIGTRTNKMAPRAHWLYTVPCSTVNKANFVSRTCALGSSDTQQQDCSVQVYSLYTCTLGKGDVETEPSHYHALSTKTRLWSTDPTPSQVSYKSIHYHDGEETIDPEIGSQYINRITQITRSRSRPEVEECRGRPLFHVIPRKTCSIDPTFIQKLTRFDSPGTRKSWFCLQFRSACSIHCICEQNRYISILQGE